MIEAARITGLVLAGGRGQRMGGIDKGLQAFRGEALVCSALKRLAPQVGSIAVNANRHLDVYAAYGYPVWPDAGASAESGISFDGPLAGMLAGLGNMTGDYLATVPCDAPSFPLDLVERLGRALERANADLAVARVARPDGSRRQPVFCLISRRLQPSLDNYLRNGGRKVGDWISRTRHADVDFDDAAAFANINSLDDLHALEAATTRAC